MNAMPELTRALQLDASPMQFAFPGEEKLEKMMDIQRRIVADVEQRIADRNRNLRRAIDDLETERVRLLDHIHEAKANAAKADAADMTIIVKARAFIVAE